MDRNTTVIESGRSSLAIQNKVLKNTYLLLSATLLFGGAMAWLSKAMNIPPMGLMTLLIYFGLLFAVEATKNSSLGILFTFLLTGFLGFTLGPILNIYSQAFVNGDSIITLAFLGTGGIFVGMSLFAATTKVDLSRFSTFIVIGILVAFVLSLVGYFMQLSGLALAVSGMFLLLSSMLIALQTQEIIKGGETNYISATITLYVSLYNIFLSLLNLLSFFLGNRE